MYRELAQPFLKLGSCSLHPVHSAFQGRIKQLFQGQVSSATSNSEGFGELPKRKGTFDLDDLSQTSIPFLGFVALGVGIALPWEVLPVFLHGAMGNALGFYGVCGYLLLGVVAGLGGIFSWVLSEPGKFQLLANFLF